MNVKQGPTTDRSSAESAPPEPASTGGKSSASDRELELGRALTSTYALASAAAVGTTLQLLATLALGLTSSERLERIQSQSGFIYLAAIAVAATVIAQLHRHRERIGIWGTSIGAVCLLMAWAALTQFGLVTPLGLAYRGEFILYHFNALVGGACLIAAVRMRLRWREPAHHRGWRLRGVLGIAIAAVVLLWAGHFWEHWDALRVGEASSAVPQRSLGALWVVGLGSFCALLTAPLCMALLPNGPRSSHRRGLTTALIICAPLWVRVFVGGIAALRGEVVPESGAPWVCAAIVVAAFSIRTRLRFDLMFTTRLATLMIGATISFTLFAAYSGNFGQIEHKIDVIVRSLFGFVVPYPNPEHGDFPWREWQPWMTTAVLASLCLVVATIGDALTSREHRALGVAMLLFCSAGLGLTSPHLTLLASAAAALVVASPTCSAPDEGKSDARPPATDAEIDELLAELAGRLKLPDPTIVEDERGKTWAIMAKASDTQCSPTEQIDLRVRRRGSELEFNLELGVTETGAAEIDLRPHRGRPRARTRVAVGRHHEQHGDARALESLQDELIALLDELEDYTFALWDSGIRVSALPLLGQLPDSAGIHALITTLQQVQMQVEHPSHSS